MTTTLIVTEKPDAALHVAEALDTKGEPKKFSFKGVPMYVAERASERLLVCSALGHLYKVDQTRSSQRRDYPVWEYAWKPIHLAEHGRERYERWLNAIAAIAKQAQVFVNACDFDVEGSLIGYMILKYAGAGADAKARRMKFSTLTREELQYAYEHMLPQLDYPLIDAGLCRHEVDWLYGINLSRALTESARKLSGRYATLSTGRVQGPTLRFVVDREQEIETFVPVPRWEIQAEVEINGENVPAEFEIDKFDVKAKAENVASLSVGKVGLVEQIESKVISLAPPFPLDLSTLQTEAYRHCGMTPRYSLGVAERLYLDTLISYPRTSSQKLPASIGYERILRDLGANPNYAQPSAKLLNQQGLHPNEGNKTDPAHPAVYPTGGLPKWSLEPRESKLYDLIVKRFMATLAPPAIRETVKAIVKVNDLRFYLRGSHILVAGWIDFYKPYAKFEDVSLPRLNKGTAAKFVSVKAVEKFSQPPSRYNPSSLLREMETNKIGTKATRAETIETLVRRSYIKGDKIEVTPLGIQIVEVLEKFCPRVLDVAFTRELEEMMEGIELGKEEKQHVVNEAVHHLKPIMEELKAQEQEVGEQLTNVVKRARTAELTLSVPCPVCGRKLHVVKSQKSGKRFIGCLGKWEGGCTFTLPLPQLGRLTLLDNRCNKCGFQLVKVASKGRRSFVTCPMCYVKK
jgi:DNA topoisomerase-1